MSGITAFAAQNVLARFGSTATFQWIQKDQAEAVQT